MATKLLEQSETQITTAKLFKNGRSQAVRLPKEFRFDGNCVRIRRTSEGVLLEPVKKGKTAEQVDAWFAKLDSLNELAGPFMPEGRNQPPMPPPVDLFD